MLYQDVIPNTHTLLWFRTLTKESMNGQLKPPLETSVYSFEENRQGGSTWRALANSKKRANLYSSTQPGGFYL